MNIPSCTPLMASMNSSIPGEAYESPSPCQMTRGRGARRRLGEAVAKRTTESIEAIPKYTKADLQAIPAEMLYILTTSIG